MKRSRFYGLVAGLIFLLVAVVFLGSSGAGASGSSLSKSPTGLLAARLYLEKRGAEVAVLDNLPVAGEASTLVLAGPFQRSFGGEAQNALGEHLRRGGLVIYAYSGQVEDGHESQLREELGLEDRTQLRGEVPLAPLAWRDFRNEIFRLQPEADSPLRQELEVAAFAKSPRPPAGARVFYRAGQGLAPVVFEYEHQRGRVLVLPAPLLSNAEIHRAGNAGLLELVLARGGTTVAFDEMHHGLARIEEVSSSARLGWNVFLLQLILLYLTALWTLARGFGPAWAERLPQLGSAAAFFEQLGSLHHRLGHHRAAARALVERARALDPQVPAELLERPTDTRTPFSSTDFLDLAREVSRHQPRRTKK